MAQIIVEEVTLYQAIGTYRGLRRRDPLVIAQTRTYHEAHEALLAFIQYMVGQGYTATRDKNRKWHVSRQIALGLRREQIDLDILLPSALLN